MAMKGKLLKKVVQFIEKKKLETSLQSAKSLSQDLHTGLDKHNIHSAALHVHKNHPSQ